jgi:hypothetical protein
MLKVLKVSTGAQPRGLLLLPAFQAPIPTLLSLPADTSALTKPDSDRAPLIVGDNFLSSEQLLAQYSQGLGSGPLTAIAAKLSSMSGYGKHHESYVYGKCIAAHLTGMAGQMACLIGWTRGAVHVSTISKFD